MAGTGSEQAVQQGVVAGALQTLGTTEKANRAPRSWENNFYSDHVDFEDAAVDAIRSILGEVTCYYKDGNFVPPKPPEKKGFPAKVLQRRQGILTITGVKLRVEGSRKGLQHEGGVQPVGNWCIEFFGDYADKSFGLERVFTIPITCKPAFAAAAMLQGRVSGTEHLQVIEQ